MIKPIFSIIIPTYNSLKTLDKTIRSVLKQSFKYYEIIIVTMVQQITLIQN